MSTTFRLILDIPRSASWNMAIDEMLMQSQAREGALPVLRFYQWAKLSVSIGYFQSIEKTVKELGCDKKGIEVVRRLTGGGKVEHGQDLTFALCLKEPNPFFPKEVKASYLKVNEALRIGLKEQYPLIDYADCKSTVTSRNAEGRVCFVEPSCHDLLLGTKKVVGSSQRRSRGTILHQSSVFLGQGAREDIIKRILGGFERLWKIDFKEEALTRSEIETARVKREERYGSAEWGYLPDGL